MYYLRVKQFRWSRLFDDQSLRASVSFNLWNGESLKSSNSLPWEIISLFRWQHCATQWPSSFTDDEHAVVHNCHGREVQRYGHVPVVALDHHLERTICKFFANLFFPWTPQSTTVFSLYVSLSAGQIDKRKWKWACSVLLNNRQQSFGVFTFGCWHKRTRVVQPSKGDIQNKPRSYKH